MKRIRMLLLCGICGIAAFLLHVAYSTRTTYRSASIVSARHKLEGVLMAFGEYHAATGEIPPRVSTINVSGKDIPHSWRVTLLPYLMAPQTAETYDVTKPHTDAFNQQAASAISRFSTFAGMTDTCVFMVSNAELSNTNVAQADLDGMVVAVSIPFQKCSWSSLEDLTADQVWETSSKDPDIVFAGLMGGCVIRLSPYVANREECVAFLTNRRDLKSTALKVHERILASSIIDDQDKRCSRSIVEKTQAN